MADPVPPPQPPLDGGTVALSRGTADRFAAATKYVEQFYRGTPEPFRRGRGGVTPVYIARVTTTCNARSGTAPGANGRGYLQLFNGTNLSDDTATGTQVILNLQNKTYVAGASSYTPVIWAYGFWWLPAPADCTLIV